MTILQEIHHLEISQLNQQFGGYYNIQKILTSTGIICISTANTGDTAGSGKYT